MEKKWLPSPLTYEMIRGRLTPLTYEMICGRLKHRFRASSYREIANNRSDEVMALLRDLLDRATGGQSQEQGSLFARSTWGARAAPAD